MNVLDKMLNVLKLNDEYEEEELLENEEEEEQVEDSDVKAKKSFFKKAEPENVSVEEGSDLKTKLTASTGGKVTPMRQPNGRKTNMEVCVIKPTAINDMREITEALVSGRTVILNLEGLDIEFAQRIIDFTSGSVLAINGNLQKISNFIILVTPTNVEISGDLQDLFNSSFDVPSVNKTKF